MAIHGQCEAVHACPTVLRNQSEEAASAVAGCVTLERVEAPSRPHGSTAAKSLSPWARYQAWWNRHAVVFQRTGTREGESVTEFALLRP
jgi:hypothetical protein